MGLQGDNLHTWWRHKWRRTTSIYDEGGCRHK